MRAEKTRSTKEALLKARPLPLPNLELPSKIPTKTRRTTSREKPQPARENKRPIAALEHEAAGKDKERVEHDLLIETPPRGAQTKKPRVVPQPKLQARAQELVDLIPSLSGVDVSRLVAAIKRRRQHRTSKAKQTLGGPNPRELTTARPAVVQRQPTLQHQPSQMLQQPDDEEFLQSEFKELKQTLQSSSEQKILERFLAETSIAIPAEEPVAKQHLELPQSSLAQDLSQRATRYLFTAERIHFLIFLLRALVNINSDDLSKAIFVDSGSCVFLSVCFKAFLLYSRLSQRVWLLLSEISC